MVSKESSLKICIVCIVLFAMFGFIAGKCNPKTDHHNCIKMGPSENCDDGKSHLEVDWDRNDKARYKCTLGKKLDYNDQQIDCLLEENLKLDDPKHHCMKDVITYSQPLPASGAHRPVWPVYGEYLYMPRQRYLHALEHGGLVALYHPCVAYSETTLLFKSFIKKCLRRYVIGINRNVSPKYPYVLLTYGNRLQMNKPNEDAISAFIKKHAILGAEKTSADGDYNEGLIEKSKIISDFNDSKLCPRFREKIGLKQCRRL